MSVEKPGFFKETVLPVVITLGLGSTAVMFVRDFAPYATNSAPAEASDDKSPGGRFDPYEAGTRQLGSINCDSSDPNERSLAVSLEPPQSPMSGILKIMQGPRLNEAVKVVLFDGGDEVKITSWRPIPGMESSLNKSYRRVPGGVGYKLADDTTFTVEDLDGEVVLGIACVGLPSVS